ncbi:hypothetical protein [Pseudomonas sp. CCI3.1]|uniref:hypothetical protein n=1 Tax=Pseudomonas sp. CCI3.1 TaxID=3048618 RepID=UPI002AB3C18A|nr:MULTISPECIES: hypothetical protein [unclassified Pseudomonas]MDY7581222.1 hypothetical protein [Pseudomonas sp. CCI3.1]MEB0068481.1 hypothetical protein [Pseudomonas sp. CCI3.1]MEB0073043.1 hypothetical protein [Pseudomonas sp. CCI1.4]
MDVLKLLLKVLVSLPVKLLGWSFNGRDVNIGYQLCMVFYICMLTIVSVVLAYFFASYFPGRSQSDAFMRVGAVATLLGLWAAYRLDHLVMPYHKTYGEAASPGVQKVSNNLKKVVVQLNRLCLFTAVAGAVVWGYGDLFYEYMNGV